MFCHISFMPPSSGIAGALSSDFQPGKNVLKSFKTIYVSYAKISNWTDEETEVFNMTLSVGGTREWGVAEAETAHAREVVDRPFSTGGRPKIFHG